MGRLNAQPTCDGQPTEWENLNCYTTAIVQNESTGFPIEQNADALLSIIQKFNANPQKWILIQKYAHRKE